MSNEIVNIFRTDQVRVSFRKGLSSHNFLVITFNPLGIYKDPYWGDDPIKKLGYHALGFTSSGPNWFPQEDMLRCIEAAKMAVDLEQYDMRILYGHSMGAYAALKYSRALRADRVLAFSPQFTIDPDDTRGHHSGYSRFYNRNLHSGMRIEPSNLSGRIFVFYDNFSRDAFHCNSIEAAAKANPNVEFNRLRLPLLGHQSIKAFKGTQRFSSIIKLVVDDPASLLLLAKNMHREYRGLAEIYKVRLKKMVALRAKRARRAAKEERRSRRLERRQGRPEA